MPWNTCRHGDDPQPWSPRRSKSGVDELDFNRPNSLSARLEMKMELETPLSPIEEEGPSEPSIAPLQIKLTLRFFDPAVRSVFDRTYSSSQSLLPTDRLCRGLLRRIEHCSEELITRKDSGALTPTQCLLKGPKDLRFEINFQIYRKDHSGAWAERALKSYQKQPLNSASAMEVIRSAHNIIGVFLKRHDDHFRWLDEPVQEAFPEKPTTFKPSVTGPLDLACVPRSRFIESTQRWEAIPGYTLEITLESKDTSRPQPDIKRILKVDSTQTAPLNLSLAEDLSWQAYRAVENALDLRKHAFDMEHASCDAVDGVPDCGCQHFVQDALKVDLRSVNNLGPTYEHLDRDIQSRLRLFKHPTGQDCDEFVNKVRACFQELRDRTDEKLNMLNDFDLRIAEMIGHGWRIKNPARFIIDGKQSYTRRSIEALLDRIRTGVGDVLRGHDVAIRMIAYKRGHLILDKALIARNHQESPTLASKSPEYEQLVFIAAIKERIQEDIDMICKDTCSLEDLPEFVSEHEQLLRLHTTRTHHFKPRSMASQGSLYTLPGSPGIFTEPPVPPCVPTRKSSRVFPLVPGRYADEEERPRSITTSARDSAMGMDSESIHGAPGGSHKLDWSASARGRESHLEDGVRGEGFFGLRPAAELRRVDDSSSSISTYSSLPALTESETPSPGQSMLTTPDCVRNSSPQPGISPFSKDSDSEQLIMAASGPKISEPEILTGPKAHGVSFVRPRTPLNEGAPDSVSPSTPRASRASISTDASAVTRASRKIRQAYQDGIETEAASQGDLTISSVLHDVAASDSQPTGVEVTDTVSKDEEDFPAEGWLLHCEEDVDEQDVTEEDAPTLASNGGINVIVDINESGSPEALRPCLEETVTSGASETRSSEQHAPIETDEVKAIARPASEQVEQEIVSRPSMVEEYTQSSGQTEALESTEQVGTSEGVVEAESACRSDVRNLSTEDEVSQSEAKCFGENEDPKESENHQDHCPSEISVQPQPDLQPEHSVPSSASVPDVRQGCEASEAPISRIEEHGVVERMGDSESELHSDASETVVAGPETRVPDLEATSEMLDAVKVEDGIQANPEATSGSSKVFIDAPDKFSRSSENTMSVGEQVVASVRVFPPETIPDSESTSIQRPSSTRSAVKSDYLHPLPVSTKLGARIIKSKNSFSSCSEWEDCASEPRQSFDSVDTFRLAPSEGGDEPEGSESPIQLSNPTAGFLGLRESRWAGFGIRSALTGTRAFDMATTTTLPQNPRHKDRYPQKEPNKGEPVASIGVPHARPYTSHRKMIHLSHKKSNSCVIFPGPQVKSPKLSKKGSKELEASERATPKGEGNINSSAESNPDEGGGRFPRAMMLVAGLAIVSSVVNRHSA